MALAENLKKDYVTRDILCGIQKLFKNDRKKNHATV